MSATPAHADLILLPRWIAPVEGPRLLTGHALVVKDGKIADLLPADVLPEHWQADQTLHLDHHLLAPGLINAHSHAAMNLFRGLADDLPLMTWLEEHIWPAEGRWVSDEFVFQGARLATAEMIRCGTTCFGDMYFFPDATARAASEAGLRTVLFSPVLDFPTPMGQGPDDYLRLAIRCADDWQHEPLITTGFGPHAPYTVSDEPLKRIAMLAEELDAPIMMHLHEAEHEVSDALKNTGERPIARLERLGLLSPRLLAVHMTAVNDDDIAMTATNGCHVAHCPQSNLKLASGFCPVEQLRQAGINVALGTDGAASNNDLDMLSELQTAALLAKGVARRADALPADEALRMATLNGARALGLDQQTGSLVPGKNADMIAVDMSALETRPLFDPIAQLVYAASRHQVTHSWVAGRCLMAERELQTLNEDRLLRDADNWQEKLLNPSSGDG